MSPLELIPIKLPRAELGYVAGTEGGGCRLPPLTEETSNRVNSVSDHAVFTKRLYFLETTVKVGSKLNL